LHKKGVGRLSRQDAVKRAVADEFGELLVHTRMTAGAVSTLSKPAPPTGDSGPPSEAMNTPEKQGERGPGPGEGEVASGWENAVSGRNGSGAESTDVSVPAAVGRRSFAEGHSVQLTFNESRKRRKRKAG
jgi:hypothetical protein